MKGIVEYVELPVEAKVYVSNLPYDVNREHRSPS